MKRTWIISFGAVLVVLATTVGLTATSSPAPQNVQVVIDYVCSLTVEAGNYDYGTLAAWTAGTQSATVTLRAATNYPTYSIAFRAGGPVLRDGSATTDIALADFCYGTTPLSLVDTTIINGVKTTSSGVEHEIQLDLNLDGDEQPGTYTTTVIFTMTAPGL